MPSRLTGLTQKFRNNNANNIDKLNSLTFKSQFTTKSSKKLSDGQSEDSTEDQSDYDENNDRKKESESRSDVESEGDDTESNSIPKRSVHSSRVIKPNKKFIEESKTVPCTNGVVKRKGSKSETDSTDQTDIHRRDGNCYLFFTY